MAEIIHFRRKGKVGIMFILEDIEATYEPAPYEPCQLFGKYRCECCGFYFDLDEGEFKDDMFLCKQDFDELNLLERKQKAKMGEPS